MLDHVIVIWLKYLYIKDFKSTNQKLALEWFFGKLQSSSGGVSENKKYVKKEELLVRCVLTYEAPNKNSYWTVTAMDWMPTGAWVLTLYFFPLEPDV